MRRRLRLLPAVAAAATLLVLSGCGDGGGGGGGGEPDPPAAVAQPDGAPEALAFTATTVAGEPFDAAELAGEPVVLWFWAGWCPRCRAAAPDVLAAAEQVTVIGVAGLVLTDESEFTDFIEDTGTGQLTHLADAAGDIYQRFDVTTQDRYVLIDADGEIVHNGSLTGQELRDRANELAG